MDINCTHAAFSKFNELISKGYNESYPLIKKTINTKYSNNPWMTIGIKTSINKKQKLYKKYFKQRITMELEYKRYRNLLNNIIKMAKNKYYQQKLTQTNGDSKKTWKLINDILG